MKTSQNQPHPVLSPKNVAAIRPERGMNTGEFLPLAGQSLPVERRDVYATEFFLKRKTAIIEVFHGILRRVAENLSVAQPLLKGALQ
jgi:hypothetical protein